MRLKLKIGSNKLKNQKQLDLLSDLEIFLSKKYSIYDTLLILNDKYYLKEELEMLCNGSYVFEILRLKIIDNDVLLVLEIAEKSGNLSDGITKSKLLLEQKISSSNQLMELIKYPLLLTVVMTLAILFIGFFLIPQFESIYISFGLEISVYIKVIFALIKGSPFVLLILLSVIFLCYGLFKQVPSQIKIKYLLTNKYTSKYYQAIYNQIFIVNLVNLLDVGLKLDEVMDVLIFQKYNLFLRVEAIKIKRKMQEGCYLYEALNAKYYSSELILLVEEGERNNCLKSNCESYLKYVISGQSARSKQLLFWIQPIMYLFFGVLIIIVYASIFIPMFKMMEQF